MTVKTGINAPGETCNVLLRINGGPDSLITINGVSEIKNELE